LALSYREPTKSSKLSPACRSKAAKGAAFNGFVHRNDDNAAVASAHDEMRASLMIACKTPAAAGLSQHQSREYPLAISRERKLWISGEMQSCPPWRWHTGSMKIAYAASRIISCNARKSSPCVVMPPLPEGSSQEAGSFLIAHNVESNLLHLCS
jgi:hypothetical protein